MIISPCWDCWGQGRPDCNTCHGTGTYKTTRLDAWARRKLYLGSQDKKADRNGNEKWTRFQAEIPPEFEGALAEAYKAHTGRYPESRAAITTVALWRFLERYNPEEDPPVEANAQDIIIRPKLESGAVSNRAVTEITRGDFVKLGDGQWHEVHSNSAAGVDPLPREWTIELADGRTVGMYDVLFYAKQEDFDDE